MGLSLSQSRRFTRNSGFFIDCLGSIRGLAKIHQTGLGFLHAHHSDPSKELRQPVALWLVENLADRCDATLEKLSEGDDVGFTTIVEATGNLRRIEAAETYCCVVVKRSNLNSLTK